MISRPPLTLLFARPLPLAVLILLLTAHCTLLTVAAQSSTATLSGTVEDENGAVIPGAVITVKNYATSLERHGTTNDSGSFTIPLLPPGEYTVLVEREGFTRVQLTNIVLNVGDQKAVQVQLKVGDVASTVEVRADPSLVRTDGSVGTVVDRAFVQNIPLNGRSFQSLLELTPGVVMTPANAQAGGQFSVNGQRTNSNYFMVDGVSANTGLTSAPGGFVGQTGSGSLPGLTASGTTASLVSVDALQEFRIQTSTYAPEFGRQPGGQVSLVTRSGGNDYHGTVFDYIRNEAFDANDWFLNRNGQPKPPTRQHMFGGTLGGPIFFPNFGEGGKALYSGKDRTFFFFSYEGLRLQQPKAVEINLPTLCFRGEGSCSAGQTPALPQYQPFLRAFPKPNGPDVGNGFARFTAGYSDPSRYDATALRIDHTAGKLTFFGRFSWTPSRASTRFTSGPSSIANATLRNTSFTAGSTWVFSNNIINDIRANYTTNDGPHRQELDDFGGAVPLPVLGFLGRSPATSRFGVVISGTPSNLALNWGTDTAYKQRQFNIVDNMTVTAGDHQVKFGVDFRRSNPLLHIGGGLGSENIVFTAANLIGGQSQSGQILNYNAVVRDDQSHSAAFDNLSAYMQDTWKINGRLTMTYGVRWEFVPPPHATEGPNPRTLEGLDNPFAPNSVSLAPLDTPLWNTKFFNFAPRFGASYLLVEKPGRQFVIRGGAGIFYDLGFGESAGSFTGVAWPFTAFFSYPLTGHPDPQCASSVRFPLPACALVLPVPGTTTTPGGLSVLDRNLVAPRTYQWNLSVEQSIGTNQTITVSYVGAAGRELLKNNIYNGIRLVGFNYAGSTATQIQVQRNGSYSDYEALQFQFQRRLSRGFQGLVAYTFGRSRDTSSDETSGIPTDAIRPDQDYGFSSFDVRHNVTAAATYEIPGLKLNPFLKAVTRGWVVDTMFRARTAFPMNVSLSTAFPGLPGNTTIRPNLIPDVAIYFEDPNSPGGRRLNSAVPTPEQIAAAGCRPRSTTTPAIGAFCTPQLGQQGNLMRGFVRGFGAKQIDLSLRHEFPILEKVRLQLRLEAFNIFNWPNFSNASGSFSSTTNAATYGSATQMLNRGLGGLSALYQIGGPRSMQFAARISF